MIYIYISWYTMNIHSKRFYILSTAIEMAFKMNHGKSVESVRKPRTFGQTWKAPDVTPARPTNRALWTQSLGQRMVSDQPNGSQKRILLKISFTKWGALRPLQACHFVVRGCFFAFLCTSKLIRNHFCEISANSRHIHFVDNPLSAVAIWSQCTNVSIWNH